MPLDPIAELDIGEKKEVRKNWMAILLIFIVSLIVLGVNKKMKQLFSFYWGRFNLGLGHSIDDYTIRTNTFMKNFLKPRG
jgi:hypothetical protein